MNLRLNSLNFFSSWFVTRWASLALPLAFSAVIGWSAPARGDVVVWDTGPFCEGCTLTNIVFVSLEQFDAFTNQVAGHIYLAWARLSVVTQSLDLAEGSIYVADAYITNALARIESYGGPYLARGDLAGARNNLGTTSGSEYTALGQISKAREYAAASEEDLRQVGGAFYNGVDSTRAQVATACESGEECCCQCPDYTSYLQTIISSLASIEDDTAELRSYIYLWNRLLYGNGENGILPFLYNLGYGMSQFYRESQTDSAIYLATDLGTVVSNAAFTVSSLQGWARIRDIWNGTFNSAGDFYADEDNALAKRLADVWTRFLWFTEPGAPADFDNPYILGWRDFQVTKNSHPTNTADNPLWVRVEDSASNSLSVSVDGLGDDFYSSLSNLLAHLEIQVINSLSQPSLHVTVDNTNDFTLVDSPGRLYENVVNNSTTINNIASEVTGQQAEYDEPDWTLDDYGSLFDKSAEMRDWDFVGKWADMFDDVTIEPPGPCKLWDGFAPNSGNDSGTPGPWGGWSQIIDVGSLYWYPMESCGGLIRSIRGVFRALWTLVILFVIAGLVRINWLLARCGVRILIAVVSAFGSPDPMGAVVEVFETVLKALSQLYTGLFGGRPAESD